MDICFLTKVKCSCTWPEEDCPYVSIRRELWPNKNKKGSEQMNEVMENAEPMVQPEVAEGEVLVQTPTEVGAEILEQEAGAEVRPA